MQYCVLLLGASHCPVGNHVSSSEHLSEGNYWCDSFSEWMETRFLFVTVAPPEFWGVVQVLPGSSSISSRDLTKSLTQQHVVNVCQCAWAKMGYSQLDSSALRATRFLVRHADTGRLFQPRAMSTLMCGHRHNTSMCCKTFEICTRSVSCVVQ